MLRIWIITILVCFSFEVLAEISSKRESNRILIKKNLSKAKEVDPDKKKGIFVHQRKFNFIHSRNVS